MFNCCFALIIPISEHVTLYFNHVSVELIEKAIALLIWDVAYGFSKLRNGLMYKKDQNKKRVVVYKTVQISWNKKQKETPKSNKKRSK